MVSKGLWPLAGPATVWRSSCLPWFFGPDDGVEDGDELVHTGDEGDFARLSSSTQAVVERLDHRIEPRANPGRHIQRRPHSHTPTANMAAAAMLAAVMVQRRNANQCRHRTPIQLTQLRQFGQQGGVPPSGPHTAPRSTTPPAHGHSGLSSTAAVDVGLDAAEFLLQPADMRIQTLLHPA